MYLDATPQSISAVHVACSTKDFSRIASEAHQMKSSSANVGADNALLLRLHSFATEASATLLSILYKSFASRSEVTLIDTSHNYSQ